MSSKKELTLKQKKLISVISIVLVVIFSAAVMWFVGKPAVSFVSEPEKFRMWVSSHGLWGRIAFVGMTVFQVVIALVPGEPFEIGAGYAFGAFEGTLLSMIGTFIGSVLVFYAVRRFGTRLVEVFFNTDKIKSLKFLQNEKRLDAVTFIVFFLPGTPKDLLTYFAGLTDINPAKFFIIATFARLPSIITSTVGGSALGMKKYTFAIVVFAVTLVISILGIMIYNQICRLKQKNNMQ